MILTKRQQEGLILALNHYKHHREYPYTVISGYAGSGKSTLVSALIDALANEVGLNPEINVAFACYTGKAAQVLIDKGNKNATTIHKFLYKSVQRKDGTFFHRKKSLDDFIGIKLIVIDECSMVPISMIKELLALNIHIIFLGDPGQLPPINKDEDNHLLDKPDVFLDEIMRQAQESGIIRLSMKIRNNENINEFSSNEAKIFERKDFVEGMLTWSDIILCATNATRMNLNSQMRKILGHNGDICNGDKLICLRNYWSDFSDNGNALTNGVIGTISHISPDLVYYPKWVGNTTQVECVRANFLSETNDNFGKLIIDKKCILTGSPTCNAREKYQINSKKGKFLGLIDPMEFTYGYAITCHKAQGSQWNKVLVLEENFPFSKDDHKRWLYTACTRAVDKLVLVR